MNIEARSTDQGSSARHLAAAAEPVFIFDGKLPVLVWANEAALGFVGHKTSPSAADGNQLPYLDRSMPAMAQLRALAEQEIPPQGVRVDLVFWTAQGARPLACTCRRATFAFAPEALIVHSANADRATRDVTPPAATVVAVPATVQKGKPAVRPAVAPGGKSPPGPIAQPPAPAGRARAQPLKATQSRPRSDGRAIAKERPISPGSNGTRAAAVVAATSAPAPMPMVPSSPVADAGSLPLLPPLSGDAVALREIARQIQSASSGPSLSPSARPDPVTARVAAAPIPAAPAQPSAMPPAVPIAEPDFLSQIGHEIRTPLNSILGFAEIMREERLGPIGNERYRTYAADILDSAEHALSLINDLLDLSRLEAGGLPMDPVEIDVAAVLKQSVGALQPLAEKAGIVLAAPAGRPLPKLVCDARALKQMLLNLLSNAIKQTDSGGAVWAMAAIDDGGALVIRVQDTGVGMSTEDLALALQPYRQAGPAARRAGGSGLGLPLTKAMAEANGGRLSLERIAGGGLAALLTFGPGSLVVVP